MKPLVELLSAPCPVSMADEWYKLANADHFWIQWRFRALIKNLHWFPSKELQVIDIGCGNGVMIGQMEQISYTIDGCDLNIKALELIPTSKGRVMYYNIFDLRPELLNRYSMVLLMDVIEHIDNDAAFLETSKKYLCENGLLVINVPASNALFSRYDIVAGHKRRYNKKMINDVFVKAGIEPIKISYWGASLFPIAVLRKFVLKFSAKSEVIKNGFQPPGKLVHLLLKALMWMETSIPFSAPFGTSIIAIGRKKG